MLPGKRGEGKREEEEERRRKKKKEERRRKKGGMLPGVRVFWVQSPSGKALTAAQVFGGLEIKDKRGSGQEFFFCRPEIFQ